MPVDLGKPRLFHRSTSWKKPMDGFFHSQLATSQRSRTSACALGGIITAGVPGMAAADSFEAPQAAAQRTIFFHRLAKIDAAGGAKPAVAAEQRADADLIEPHGMADRPRGAAIARLGRPAPRLPQPAHASPPPLRPCGWTGWISRGWRLAVARPADHPAGECYQRFLHRPRAPCPARHPARPHHHHKIVPSRQTRLHQPKGLAQPPLPSVANHRVSHPPRNR